MKGCLSEKPVIAYQQKTHLLKNFLTNSYENDPSENTSQFIAPISFIASLALCVVCTIISSRRRSSRVDGICYRHLHFHPHRPTWYVRISPSRPCAALPGKTTP